MDWLFSNTPSHLIGSRNNLLQDSLRGEKLPFSIVDEYPIILSPKHINTSYCLHSKDAIASHLSLWVRTIEDKITGEQFTVGLIGNVATNASNRKQGLSRILFEHIIDFSQKHSLSCLILWSDLHEFYQKIGFVPQGKEFRHTFPRCPTPCHDKNISIPLLSDITDIDLARMLKLRADTTLRQMRSVSEYRRLLETPWTDIVIQRDSKGVITDYAITGKGYDLMGVIHEWGSTHQNQFLQFAHKISYLFQFDQMILLSPFSFDDNLIKKIKGRVEIHPLALVKFLTNKDQCPDFKKLFLWGLDSI